MRKSEWIIDVLILLTALILPACKGNVNSETSSLSSDVPDGVASTNNLSLFPTALSCIDGLTFISDITIPDYTFIFPGSFIDKQWLVQNSGSCEWNEHYRLRLINGEALGANEEQALFPARSGTQAILRIIFTAPFEPGEYYSEWRAFGEKGIPFGDTFFTKIIVQ